MADVDPVLMRAVTILSNIIPVETFLTTQLVVTPSRLSSKVALSVSMRSTKVLETVKVAIVPSTATTSDVTSFPTSAVHDERWSQP